jgi:hypothetical protein
MKDYAVMPPMVVEDVAALDSWIREALNYTATLPPKK